MTPTPLARARVYRNVELRQAWLGLEPFDALALVTLVWILMIVHPGAPAWNVLVGAAGFVAVRIAKRGKPEGYTTALVRFHLRRPFFSAAAPDTEGADRPFPTLDPGEHP